MSGAELHAVASVFAGAPPQLNPMYNTQRPTCIIDTYATVRRSDVSGNEGRKDMFKSIICIAFGIGLGTAVPAFASSDETLKAAIAGKTLVSGKAQLKARKNGRLSGKVGKNGDVKFEGAWDIRNGQWCRTIKEPKTFAGTKCQAMTLDGDVLTIDGTNGPTSWLVK